MDREGFRNRLQQYKKAREENPGLKYWEWKSLPKYDEGGEVKDDPEKWTARITAEGYDDKGYYAQAMNDLPEVTVTAKLPQTKKYTEYDYAKDVAGFVPVVGDAIDVYDTGKALFKGNYSEAAMLGAGLLLPNFLEKPGKLAYRYLRKKASKLFGAPTVEFYENLGRDITKRPTETFTAVKEGRYPFTFKQRKKYLLQFHETDDYYRSIQMNANQEDFWHRLSMFPDDDIISTKEFWRTTMRPDTKLNTKSTVNSRSYSNFDDPLKSEGVNNIRLGINSHVKLRNPKTNILKKPENIAGIAIHERQHSISGNLPDFDSLHAWSPEMQYYTYGGERGIVPELEKVLLPINKNAGINDWASSPGEWFSEAMLYRVRGAEGKPFREMSESERENFINFMHSSLGDNLSKYEIAKILADGSTLGYF